MKSKLLRANGVGLHVQLKEVVLEKCKVFCLQRRIQKLLDGSRENH